MFPEKDGISINLIKHFLKIKEHINDILVHIFNTILVVSSIPECFKIALVTSIHKGGNKLYISNYRPISLLNIFSKIFEIAIKNHLLKYFEELNHSMVSEKTLEQKMS